MRTRVFGLTMLTLLAIAAFGAAGARAATEFGDNCGGNEITERPSLTIFSFTATGDPLPLTAPSAGVITKWKVNVAPGATFGAITQTLQVLRQTDADTVQIVGRASGRLSGGTNTFDTRVPVQAGDRLGLFGSDEVVGGEPVGNLFCSTPGIDETLGAFPGEGGPPGSSVDFETEGEEPGRMPVFAVLEPDADNDGYGDETQDKCPQNAAVQAVCPVVVLSTSASAGKSRATVLVTTNLQATVSVAGTVNLGKGKTASLSGGTQVVLPGVISKFTILFTKSVKAKLKQLSRKRFLTLNVTSTAPNVVGLPTVSNLVVKLKGQKKARHHRKHKGHKGGKGKHKG